MIRIKDIEAMPTFMQNFGSALRNVISVKPAQPAKPILLA